jgi:hypothetical protein
MVKEDAAVAIARLHLEADTFKVRFDVVKLNEILTLPSRRLALSNDNCMWPRRKPVNAYV